MTLIYKIVPKTLWQAAEASGNFAGAPVDLADGFIHLSAAGQVQETADKHFAGQDDLLLVAFETEDLGARLKWEPSRGGQLFPHFFSALPVALARSVAPVQRDANGRHLLGDLPS